MHNNKGYYKNNRGTSNSTSPNPPRTFNSTPPNPPRVKIKSFYVEGTKNVKDELFAAEAKREAAGFIGTNKEGRYGKVTKTQIRRLYDEVKRFEQILDGSPEKWKKNYPLIKMIISKASYNVIRAKQDQPYNANNGEVYDNFLDFISEGISLIHEENDYHVFKSLFEAVYGFYYVLNPTKD